MRYLTVNEVLEIHKQVVQRTGGGIGIRDLGALESSVAQPRASFAGKELYPELADKAAALSYSLIQNHPFIDGNKRVGHASLETYLILNGYEIRATVDEQESIILKVASGQLSRDSFRTWIANHIEPIITEDR